MTQSAGFRGRKMSASAMSKDDELYGFFVRETNGEPVRNGMANKDANSQSGNPHRTPEHPHLNRRNR